VLAAGSVVFGTSMHAARWVNAGLCALTVVLGGLIVFRIRPSRVRALGAALVLALLPTTLSVYAIVFADAMLIAASLATILALYSLVERPTPWRYALVATLAFVAVSAKYAGAAVAVAAGVTVAIVLAGSVGRRLVRGAIVAAPGLLFALLWLRRGDARGLVTHLPNDVDLSTIAGTFGGWFGSGHATALRHVALAVVVLLVAAAIWTAFGRGLPPSRRALTISLGLTGVLVLVIVAFSRSFVDALVGFNHRQLLPVQVVVVLLVASFRLPASASRWLRVAAYGGIAVAAVVAIWPWSPRGGWVFLVQNRLTTIGALSDGVPAQSPDPAARFVRTLPERSVIASDFPENIWLRTGRGAVQLPGRQDIEADRANPDVDEQLHQLAGVLRGGGYLVLYTCRDEGEVFPTRTQLERLMPMQQVFGHGATCVFRVR
jgi:hypothetical protein